LESENFIAYWGGVERVESHQHPKFRKNQSVDCGDIKIFLMFQDGGCRHLDIQIIEMLLADGVWRIQTHNCSKFRHNRSLRCGNIAIFRIFKMAAAAILDF